LKERIPASLSELNQQHYNRTIIMSTAAQLGATNVVQIDLVRDGEKIRQVQVEY
jgi:hypothetical protein